ncbi:MAG: protein YgfX [Betaproteobacteria bacterium]
MQFPVSIELHRSRLFAFLLVLFHLLATVCLLVVPWPWPIRLIIVLLIGLSTRRAMRSPGIIALRLSALDHLDCFLADGNQHDATVLPCSTVFSRMIVLRLSVGEEKRVVSMTLFPDQMSANQFRILSFWLRWRSATITACSEKVL